MKKKCVITQEAVPQNGVDSNVGSKNLHKSLPEKQVKNPWNPMKKKCVITQEVVLQNGVGSKNLHKSLPEKQVKNPWNPMKKKCVITQEVVLQNGIGSKNLHKYSEGTNKKPLEPNEEETRNNPKSRSTK